jgi:hypothetical protein
VPAVIPFIVMLCSVAGTFRVGDKGAAVELAGPGALHFKGLLQLAMNTQIASSWITSKLFRVLLLIVGVLLFVMYGLMLIVVGVTLPGSWRGLVYVIIGMAGARASFRYYRSQRRLLLIVIAAALLVTIVFLVGTLLFGRKVDERLQKGRAPLTRFRSEQGSRDELGDGLSAPVLQTWSLVAKTTVAVTLISVTNRAPLLR